MSVTSAPVGVTRTPSARGDRRRTDLVVWVFLLPTIVLYGLFTIYPIVASWWYSLLDWNGSTAPAFVGVQNFVRALGDPQFWQAFRTTLLFAVCAVPLMVALGLVLAVVVNSPAMPWKGFFRTALFLPVVTTTAIVGIVMQFVFDPSNGPVNLVLRGLGISDGINFLGTSSTALPTVIGVFVWKWVGMTMVYWLAALQTVPRDVIEAAQIDRAGPARILWSVTLPILRPFAVIITLLTIEQSLQVFDLVLTMTNGGPYFSTTVMELFIYQQAFASTTPQLGYASAVAVVFGVFVCLVGVLQLLGLRAARGRAAEL